MLEEMLEDGAQLRMMDGSSYLVNPGDIPTCITWLPTTNVRIKVIGNDMIESEIHNIHEDIKIRAMDQGNV